MTMASCTAYSLEIWQVHFAYLGEIYKVCPIVDGFLPITIKELNEALAA